MRFRIKRYTMNNQANQPNKLIRMVKQFIYKLRQNPDVYPIKYYKKGQRMRRSPNRAW